MRHGQRTPAGGKAVELKGLSNKRCLKWADVRGEMKKIAALHGPLGHGGGFRATMPVRRERSTSTAQVQPPAQELIPQPRFVVTKRMGFPEDFAYSAVFEKVATSRTRGLLFQPVPPKVHPVAPSEVHGHSQFWKRAGSEFPDFGMWPLGPRLAASAVWGHNVGVPCGARGTATNSARPMAPAVPRAPWASPGHSHPWFSIKLGDGIFTCHTLLQDCPASSALPQGPKLIL